MSFGQWASDYLGVPLEERFNFNPLTYFLYSGIDGAWFDPEDMSTMFQDAAGTTPVTALEQPVGRWLDKSGNGNHATQSITASRPTLSARYNLLTKTEDFADAAWIKSFISVSTTNEIPPINFGSKSSIITPTATSQVFTEIYQNSPIYTGVTYTQYYVVKSNGHRYLQIIGQSAIFGSSYINFDIVSGEKFNSGTFSGSSNYIGNGWYIITCSATASTSSASRLSLNFINSLTSPRGGVFVGDGYSGIFLAEAQLNIGTTPLPYQRVNTATDYDSVGWPRYLRGDGIDDFYNLPFMNLYGNGSCSIVAARDAISQATDTYIISERSTTDVDPKYFPSRQLASGGDMDIYIVSDEGTVRLDTTGSAFSGAKLAVIRSVVDSGNNIKLFKDGTVVADDNYARAGTLTLNNTTIGASVSTTTGNYANMRLYGLIVTKSALSDTDRRRCEQFLAGRLSTLGVTLS